MVDSCDSSAQPEAGRLGDALAYFWHNFGRFYRGKRAPFGIHLHADWLLTNPEYFEAFLRFLKTLLADFDDVYFVTSHQAIEWMKRPQTIEEARSFLPWKRSCNLAVNATVEKSATAAAAVSTYPRDENQLQVCYIGWRALLAALFSVFLSKSICIMYAYMYLPAILYRMARFH